MTFVKKKLPSSCIYLFLFINMTFNVLSPKGIVKTLGYWAVTLYIAAALSWCMEEKLPNNATPDQMKNDSISIPTSQRLVDEELENAQKWEPSQIELDLWAAGWYSFNDW